MDLKKIVVTGGAGFIGSHLIDNLLKSGHEIINIDNFDPFYSESIKKKNISGHQNYKSYTLVRADIRDKVILDSSIPSDTDTIIHLAAKVGVRPSINDSGVYQEVNVTGTHNLLEIAREKGIKQFIFASSSSVYGKNPNVPWKESDHVLLPISPYASTKVSGELLGHVYSHLFDLRFIALRFFTVYGPRQRPDLAIHKFFKLINRGEEIQIYGDGTTRRDYTYVEDIIQGVMAAITYDESNFEVINLGNSKNVELEKIVAIIEKRIDKKAKKTYLPEKPGDVSLTWASIEKAQNLLGYKPKISISKGIEEFALWLLESKKQ